MKHLKTLILSLATLFMATTVSAQPKSFTLRMITPPSFTVITAQKPVLRASASTKAAKVKGTTAAAGTMYPTVSADKKWNVCDAYNESAKTNVKAWVAKSQSRLLKVKTLSEPVMPPAFTDEIADGSASAMSIEGPDAEFQVRSEGIYHSLPFTVGHPSGSDRYTLQFLLAGINPSYTYVVNTAFVVTRTAEKKASIAYEPSCSTLYLSVPRTVADDAVETYAMDFLASCSDRDFGQLIAAAFPADGLVPNVTVYFKGTDGKRYAYSYNGSATAHCQASDFTWKFVE